MKKIEHPTSLDDIAYNQSVDFDVHGHVREDMTNMPLTGMNKKLYDAVLFYANHDNWNLTENGTKVVIKGSNFSKAIVDRGAKARAALGLGDYEETRAMPIIKDAIVKQEKEQSTWNAWAKSLKFWR